MKLYTNILKSTSLPFWLVTLSVVFGLTLPWLIQEGMFQDAMLYSCVSHNLSIGIGTFWFPQYSTLNIEGINSFHEQLPLVFGIQAVFFKLLGDSIYVERCYTFLMILLNSWLIHKIWKLTFNNKPEYASISWLPVFFWIIIPLSFWSYRYNMMENSVSVFALGSIFFGLKAIKTQNKTFVWWILSSLFVFFASFSKGIPGLFTISFPIIYWLTTQNISFKKSLLFTLLLMLLPIIIYGLFIAIPLSRESLSIYFFDRLLTRTNSMPTANYRFEILVRLYYELLPVIILAVIILISGGIKRIKATVKENLRYFLLFLGLGVAGTFPLTLTMVQKGFYMVPAFPFFALAFAALIGPLVAIKVNQINVGKASYKLFFAFSIMVFLVIGMITFLNRNKIEREETIITDVYKIGSEVPKFSTVTVPEEMYDEYDFVLQGYLVRYFNISISPYKMYDYFLKEKSLDTQIPENYLKLDLELSKYQLYKKVD